MRGTDKKTKSLFSYVSPDDRVPADHPLRLILAVVNEVLEGLSGEFEEMYSHTGRPSIPPEQFIRALLCKTKFRGTELVNASFVLGLVAYNLVRLPGLLGAPP